MLIFSTPKKLFFIFICEMKKKFLYNYEEFSNNFLKKSYLLLSFLILSKAILKSTFRRNSVTYGTTCRAIGHFVFLNNWLNHDDFLNMELFCDDYLHLIRKSNELLAKEIIDVFDHSKYTVAYSKPSYRNITSFLYNFCRFSTSFFSKLHC